MTIYPPAKKKFLFPSHSYRKTKPPIPIMKMTELSRRPCQFPRANRAEHAGMFVRSILRSDRSRMKNLGKTGCYTVFWRKGWPDSSGGGGVVSSAARVE